MQQGYYQPPPQQMHQGYNPEVDSINSMLNIAGIISLIFGILFILSALAQLYWYFVVGSIASSYGVYGTYVASGYGTATLITGIYCLIGAIIGFLIFMQCKAITDMVHRGQYVQAKSKSLIWMIMGIIFGLIPGILILIAYLKFDPLIRASQPNYHQPPPHGHPQQGHQQPPQQQQYQQQPPQQGNQPPQY